MSDPEPAKRDTVHFEVEALVGDTWVLADTDLAEAGARVKATDPILTKGRATRIRARTRTAVTLVAESPATAPTPIDTRAPWTSKTT